MNARHRKFGPWDAPADSVRKYGDLPRPAHRKVSITIHVQQPPLGFEPRGGSPSGLSPEVWVRLRSLRELRNRGVYRL